MGKSYIILVLSFIILGILLISLGIWSYITEDIQVKKVPCYDKHNNEIIGMQCNEEENAGILAIIFGIWVLITGGMIYSALNVLH